MNFLIRLVALGLALCLPSAAQALEVIGPENRSRLTDRGLEAFLGVGRLICVDPVTGHRTFTTATLVGNRQTIIGVGHFGRSETAAGVRTVSTDHCLFRLYDRHGEPMFESAVIQQRAARPAEDYVPAHSDTPDWVILSLARRAPAAVTPLRLAPVSVRALGRLPGVFMIGHHAAPHIPINDRVFSPDCAPRPFPRSALLFRHSCDTSAGSSGSLLYLETPAGPRAVGINYAYEGEGGLNLGQIFPRDLVAALPPGAIAELEPPAAGAR